MKEFKYCHEEITMGVEIPVTVCETQKDMVKIISEYRKECKWGTADEYTVIWVIYKDGSTFYHAFNDGEAEGKFKRTGIERAVISTSWEFIVFGDFSIIDNGSISIDESDIEEYGVYVGQYDVKEQEAQEVQETVEQTETAEQTQADEAAETEPAKTPKSENVPYKMKWTNQNVDYSRANYTAVIFKFNNSKVWLQSDCVCSTQTARAIIRKLGKRFGSKSVDVKYFSDQTNEKIVSVCQLYDNSGYIFRNEIAVKNGEKSQFIKYAAKEIFERCHTKRSI